jgi:hypothetical protein
MDIGVKVQLRLLLSMLEIIFKVRSGNVDTDYQVATAS